MIVRHDIVRWPLLVLLALLAGGVGCGSSSHPGNTSPLAKKTGKPTVCVVNYPLEFFASRIGGDLVDVNFSVPSDVDPAYWQPTDAEVTQFQQADLILVNGADYARWMRQVTLPESRVVDTSQSFPDQFIRVEEGVVHSHGPGGEHSHHGFAFTTWLDPRLARMQAAAVHQGLSRILPESTTQLAANFRQLDAELEQLDQQLDAIAARYAGQPLLASHPVYQYLARRCQWNLHSLHWEPDAEPTAAQWGDVEKRLESHAAKWILWEATPRRETAERLTAMGLTSVVFEPCGNRPATNYLDTMRENYQRLATIFPE